MAKKKVVELPVLIKKSAVKEFVKEQDLRFGGETTEALNVAVADLLTKAAERCSLNNRGTVRPQDL